jgi:hypothetical protein
VFVRGQVVAVYAPGKLIDVARVVENDGHIVTLDNGTRWDAKTGIPLRGRLGIRLSSLTDAQAAMLRKAQRLRRIAELVTVLVEHPKPAEIPEALAERIEAALTDAVEKVTRESDFCSVRERLRIAEAGALEQWRHELTLARS